MRVSNAWIAKAFVKSKAFVLKRLWSVYIMTLLSTARKCRNWESLLMTSTALTIL